MCKIACGKMQKPWFEFDAKDLNEGCNGACVQMKHISLSSKPVWQCVQETLIRNQICLQDERKARTLLSNDGYFCWSLSLAVNASLNGLMKVKIM